MGRSRSTAAARATADALCAGRVAVESGRRTSASVARRRLRAWLLAVGGAGLIAYGFAAAPPPPSAAQDAPPPRTQLKTGVRLQARVRPDPAAAPQVPAPPVEAAPNEPPSSPTASGASGAAEPQPSGVFTDDQRIRPAEPAPFPAEPGEFPPESPDDSAATDDSPPAPAAPPAELPSEIFPAEFQGIAPGRSTAEQVREALGPPLHESTGGASRLWTYKIGPFPRIEFRITDDRVESIRIHLAEPTARKPIADDLEIDDFETAYVVDSQGRLRGEIVPERGLQLVWVADAEPPEITQILLEAPSSDGFLRRAEQEPLQRYQRMLSDLVVARRLNPADPGPLAAEARVRLALGQPAAALELAEAAAQQAPDSLEIRLLKARLLIANRRPADARRLLDELLAVSSAPADLKSAARCQLGELLVRQPDARSDAALAQFQAAIGDAATAASADDPAVRRRAHVALIDAYLGGAQAIAYGGWQNRAAAVDKWWRQAQELADELPADDPQAIALRWEVRRRQVELTSLAGGRLPAPSLELLRHDGRRAAERAGDPLLANRLDWDLAVTLLHAAELAQANQLWPEAREFAEEAWERSQTGSASREPGDETRFTQGRIAFLIGAFHAVVSKDDAEVAAWFDRAAGAFASVSRPTVAAEQARHGERLALLGRTYARLDRLDDARRWLARSVDLLEPLAQNRAVPASRAAAVLHELADVHRRQGKTADAYDLVRRADRLDKR